MKLPLFQMIAIVCIFTITLMTIDIIIPKTYAHGDAHWFQTTVIEVKDRVCTECGGHFGTEEVQRYQTWAAHADGMPHPKFFIRNVGTVDVICLDCGPTSS